MALQDMSREAWTLHQTWVLQAVAKNNRVLVSTICQLKSNLQLLVSLHLVNLQLHRLLQPLLQ